MKTRQATIKDLKACAEIFKEEANRPPYSKNRTLKKAEERIKSYFKRFKPFVAIIDKKIIGFIIVDKDPDEKKLYINELWISKEYQRQGLGKKILKNIEDIYKKKGIKKFYLVADTRKGGALGFYKKQKYKVDKNMVFMEKKLK